MTKKYKKIKPIIVDGVKWDGENQEELHAFLGDSITYISGGRVTLTVTGGSTVAIIGDYIVKNEASHIFVLDSFTFEGIYEEVQDV